MGWRKRSGTALLESLSTQYCMVSEKTTSLHLACQHLLEQTKLAELDRELGLVRAGCAFLLHVCEDKYQLWWCT